jgi:hypothetical protein
MESAGEKTLSEEKEAKKKVSNCYSFAKWDLTALNELY